MREILSSHNNDVCEWHPGENAEYENLIKTLSEMHIPGSSNPEVLCRAKFRKDFRNNSPNFDKVQEMQERLFTLARSNLLPWARNYYHY